MSGNKDKILNLRAKSVIFMGSSKNPRDKIMGTKIKGSGVDLMKSTSEKSPNLKAKSKIKIG